MRILFVQRNARLGGGTTYLRTLLPALQRRGHQCELMIRPGTGSAGLEAALGKKPSWHPPVAGWAARRIGALIRRERIDLVNTQTTRCAQHALSACKREGIPLVMSLHSITDLTRSMAAVEYARSLVVLSENARQTYAARYPALADKLRLIRLPVDLDRFRPGEQDDDTTRVLYLGRLTRTKGSVALDLVEAIALLLPQFGNMLLTVVGTGSQLKLVRRKASELNRWLGRQVIEVVGATAHPERFISSAEIVVGAGYCALEALAGNCKVIGLGVAGLFGLVTPDNVNEAIAANFGDTGAAWAEIDPPLLADQIRQACERSEPDPQWARKVLQAQFAPDKVAQSVEAIFAEALSK